MKRSASQKASLKHYRIFALSQEEASLHRPFLIEDFYVPFSFRLQVLIESRSFQN